MMYQGDELRGQSVAVFKTGFVIGVGLGLGLLLGLILGHAAAFGVLSELR